MAAVDDGQEKRLHVPETIWQRGRNCSIMGIEPPVAFLPSVGSLTPKLFAKIFTNKRMRIEASTIVRIFSGEKSCSSQFGKNRSPFRLRVDQTNLTYGERTAQGPRQTRSGKMP